MNGTVTLQNFAAKGKSKSCWHVDAKPHVITRLKRVFAKVESARRGGVFLLDTPENARELSWFLDRYPMAVSPAEHLQAQAEAHRSRESRVQAILSGDYKPNACHKLAIPARDYQQVAADLLTATGRLLVGDQVGVGKSLVVIAAIAQSGLTPAVVVTMTHLTRQWASEFERFLPTATVHVIKKASPYQLDGIDGWPDIIILNYHKLDGWHETLAPIIKSISFDEIHELRREESNKYAAAYHLARSSAMVCGLSATPILNYGVEMFSVMNALEEDCLGTREEFLREHCAGSDQKACLIDPDAFGLHLREQGLMLRRTRQDVGRELPPVSFIPYEIDADKDALKKVRGQAADLARIILAASENKRGDKWQASREFDMRMRQATGLAKAPFVSDFVQMLVESGEKVVLFAWHHLVYEIYQSKLAQFNPAMYTGQQSVAEKARQFSNFVSGDSKVLIMSLRAGAGLNGLQDVCRTVVIGEPDWSPGIITQCVGRVARDGQQHPVTAYFPYTMSPGSSDPVMMDVLGVKRGQIEGLLNPGAPVTEQAEIDPNHLKKMAAAFLSQLEGKPVSIPEGEFTKPDPVTEPRLDVPRVRPRVAQPTLFDEVTV